MCISCQHECVLSVTVPFHRENVAGAALTAIFDVSVTYTGFVLARSEMIWPDSVMAESAALDER